MRAGRFPAVGVSIGARVRRFTLAVTGILSSPPFCILLLGVIPLLLTVPAIAHAVTGERNLSDFLSFWNAGRRVIHGESPYPSIDSLPAVADPSTFAPFVYPAPAAFAVVPIAVLPFAVAASLWLALSMASIALALHLLDVRDWRCYGAVLASVPVFASNWLGTFSPLLLLGATAAWRYRAHTLRVGPIVAALVVAKLFLWPLWLWLVYTRRYAAAALAVAVGAIATFGAWALIGFDGLRDYPRLLSRMTELVATGSYSPYALLHALGLGSTGASRVAFLIGVAVIASAALLFRADRTSERPFLVALGAGLLTTPILWPHYLVLLALPTALARPRFSVWWLLPLLLWFDGDGRSGGDPGRILAVLCLAFTVFAVAERAGKQRADAFAGGALGPSQA